jgi:hypothetical protein
MSTTIAQIISEVRTALIEPTPNFWTDVELAAIMRHGALDLWGAILDIHQEHYYVVNETDCFIKAGDGHVSNVPSNCFRIQLIEPRDTTTTGAFRGLAFIPRRFNHPDFSNARAVDSFDPNVGEMFYDVTGVGSPIEAPRILTAPLANSDILLRVVYNPTLVFDLINPVPGESDHALKNWTIAFARAKENESRLPDAGFLAVYQTEKQAILTRLTPRQEQDPEVVEGLFDWVGGYY